MHLGRLRDLTLLLVTFELRRQSKQRLALVYWGTHLPLTLTQTLPLCCQKSRKAMSKWDIEKNEQETWSPWMNVYFSENKPINKVDSAWFSQAFKKKKRNWAQRWTLHGAYFEFLVECVRFNSRPKLHLVFGCWPWWFIFFKNLFYQKPCKCAMNIGVKSGVPCHCFLQGKSALLYLCQTLPSISKMTPVYISSIWIFKSDKFAHHFRIKVKFICNMT